MDRDNDAGGGTSEQIFTIHDSYADGRLRTPPLELAPLIAAKMSRPQLLRSRVRRQRLIDMLDTAVRCPVTVVYAGAGWGKTVLVGEWAQTRRTPVAWLTLDSHDNDLQLFWSDVVAALRAAGAVPPGNPVGELELLPADEIERVRCLARGLGRLRAPAVLVLDDFHEIRGPAILRELAGLLRHPPAGFHLVLLTRSVPALALHRLRATGELAEIRASDLAFTAEEAADLLARHDLTLTGDEVKTLLDRIEGWPAGLQLAATFMAGGAGPRTVAEFAGDVRAVDEYLADEVLAGLPPHLRRFLLYTSICEHLSGELADAIMLQSDGQRTLEELERTNDFVVRLGAKPSWFRYHLLLRDVLRHRLLLEAPTAVPELHRRAAGWYAAHNSILAAIDHAMAAQDWSYVGRLVVSRAAPLIVSVHRADLAKMLTRVPPEEFASTPELMLCLALLLFDAGDYDAIPQRLAGARELLRGRTDVQRLPVEMMLRALQMAADRAVGDMPAVVDETTQMLALLAEMRVAEVPSAAQYRAIALNNKGVGLLWTGRPDLAQRYLWNASTAARAAGVELVEINALGHLALLEAMSGSVREAAELAGSARDLAERRGWLYAPQSVAAHMAVALVYIERGDTAQAQRALQQGRRADQSDPEATQRLMWLGTQARLALAEGEPGKARVLLDEARRDRDPRTRAPDLDRWLLLVESRVDLAMGRPEKVEQRYAVLARESQLTMAEQVCRARAAFAVRDLPCAEELLAALHSAMPEPVAEVEGRILSAMIADAGGHGARAVDQLAAAFAIADREDIRGPFLAMHDARLAALVDRQKLLVHRNAAFVAGVRNEMHPNVGLPQVSPPAGQLSERETEVLRYLPTMLTTGEIAAELGVSVNTAKAHIRSIYRKLAVPRRREAVSRARERGLI